MNREDTIERVAHVQGLVDDLLDLDAVFSTKHTIVMRGRPRVPLADFRTSVRGRYAAAGYECRIESAEGRGEPSERVLLTVVVEESARKFPWLNVLLFVLTVVSVWFSIGGQFAVWFLAILLFHEFGHFIAARVRKIDTSWPYFIPAPVFLGVPSILGTFGAFIQLRSPIRDRRALFDMAAAGPLAGLVVAVVALFVGLSQSTIAEPGVTGGLKLGESLLFRAVAAIVLPAPVGPGQDIILHPVAYAGWAGLLVTMFNLMPIGQLDGGHIAYALIGRRQRYGALAVMGALIVLSYWWPGWLFLVAFGLIMRPKHPPTLIDEIPLGGRRVALGWICMATFVLTFVPVPLSL
jgi:membrane-associated protease RseP (regulator of RpoE activity)